MKNNVNIPSGLTVGDKYKCIDGFTWECVFYLTSGDVRMECQDLLASESIEDFFQRENIEEIIKPSKRYYDHYDGELTNPNPRDPDYSDNYHWIEESCPSCGKQMQAYTTEMEGITTKFCSNDQCDKTLF